MSSFRRLQCFIVVAEELNFHRAAERLHISQPPLTRHIQMLEEELGVELIRRTTKRVELTPAGSVYLAEARKIIAMEDSARELARRAAGGMPARLRLAHSGSVMYCAPMREVVRQLLELRLSLKFIEMSTIGQHQALTEGRVDVGINAPFQIEAPPDIRGIPLFRERLMLACPETDCLVPGPVDIPALEGRPLILYAPELKAGLSNRVLDLYRNAGITPPQTIEVTQLGAIPMLVAGGAGISLLPRSVGELSWPGVTFVHLTEDIGFDVHAAWTERTPKPVIEILRRAGGGREAH